LYRSCSLPEAFKDAFLSQAELACLGIMVKGLKFGSRIHPEVDFACGNIKNNGLLFSINLIRTAEVAELVDELYSGSNGRLLPEGFKSIFGTN
jgi:hypothetical protein